jgi:uncharacterized LabA/DUF88 family protein
MTRSNKRKPVHYAFIDSQNLNLGIRSQGWRIDYKRFRLYLKNKYHVEQAYMFIGMVVGNQDLYTELQRAGFILVFKPTIQYFKDGAVTVKGNVDAELVLYASAIEYANYDKAIIISGDGDFMCLLDFLLEREKLLKLFTPNAKYSKLLSKFDEHIVRMDKFLPAFGFRVKKEGNKKDQDWRSVETLGSLGHGDVKSIANNPKKFKRSGA